jgi:SAM-dependent methyltransferase
MQQEQFQLHADIERRHWWFVARRQIVRALVEELLPPNCGHRVIDVGCGTGANVAALADGYECQGIDTSPAAIELAQRRFPDLRFTCGFAPGGLLADIAAADLIMLNDVLEHVADDAELLSSLVAAAKPGAYFLITVPADMTLWSQHDESFGHFRRYDLTRFRQTWAELPLDERLVSPLNARLYPLVRWVRVRNRQRGHSRGTAGTDFEMPLSPVNWGLQTIFASESRRLIRHLRGIPTPPFRHGVSLIAILRKQQAHIQQGVLVGY